MHMTQAEIVEAEMLLAEKRKPSNRHPVIVTWDDLANAAMSTPEHVTLFLAALDGDHTGCRLLWPERNG